MNLNFSTHALFSWYVVLLLLSGIVMLVLTAMRVGQKPAGRILNLPTRAASGHRDPDYRPSGAQRYPCSGRPLAP